MSLIDEISTSASRKIPLLLQTEAAECGLACVGMIAGAHGHRIDLSVLRRRFPISLKGATLAHLIDIARALKLATRALQLDVRELAQLKAPCILHWNLNHFVVLHSIGAKSATIYDPAAGIRKVPLAHVSKAFTGVALELWPQPDFAPLEEKQRVPLHALVGKVTGLVRSCGQILLLALALEVFALVAPFYLQWTIDNVIVSADRDLLTTLALAFGLLVLMQQAISAARSWALMHMGATLNVQWRANVFEHLLRLPIQYFEKRHLGDVVSRFGAVDQIQRTLTTSFLEGVLDGLMSVVTLTMMFIYSPPLAWIALGVIAMYTLSRWAWYKPLRAATENQIVFAAKQQSHFLETVRGVKTVKLFNRQAERRATWLIRVVDQINAELRTQRIAVSYKIFQGVLFGLENVVIIWLGARFVIDGHFTVGVLMAFHAYKEQFNSRISAFIDKIVEISMLRLHGERLADIVLTRAEPESDPARLAVAGITAASRGAGGRPPAITVSHLRYRYAAHEPWILDDISLRIAPGESVAIIGPSGCGKTTLVNILLGILKPTEGDVTIGDADLRQTSPDQLRRIIGTVTQEDVLFAGSIADNISFFDPHADHAWVEACAEMAAVHQAILAMPMGYNTLVGDMGTVLSGGQKQRVLLARALYKRPSLLILDEATSHLDVEREREVNDAVKSLDITRIIVAHRPDTIATANRVIALKGGKIVPPPPDLPPEARAA